MESVMNEEKRLTLKLVQDLLNGGSHALYGTLLIVDLETTRLVREEIAKDVVLWESRERELVS